VTQPITDVRGEVREYMQNSGMRLLPYWLATFVVDSAIWVFAAVVVGVHPVGSGHSCSVRICSVKPNSSAM
jgi:hypothetical protein